MRFNDYYYNVYLPAHTKRGTRIWHFMGCLFTIAWVAAFAILAGLVNSLYAFGLVFSPFVVYPFAWGSHLYIEKNKPLAWSNPFWAKACDWRMCYDILRGIY